MSAKKAPTEQDIEEGLNFVAYLIDKYGDGFWPVFERLERELDQRRSRKERLKRRLASSGLV